MKVRTGFVSNSSSSSYVLLLTEEKYEQLVKESDLLTKSLINHVGVEHICLDDHISLCIMRWSQGNCDSFEDVRVSKRLVKKWIAQHWEGDDPNDESLTSEVIDGCWDMFKERAQELGFMIREYM